MLTITIVISEKTTTIIYRKRVPVVSINRKKKTEKDKFVQKCKATERRRRSFDAFCFVCCLSLKLCLGLSEEQF